MIQFYYFYYVEFRIALVGGCKVGLTTDEEIWKKREKIVLMHQLSLCKF